ncbi:MAG: 4-alpha-glucanotransferase [Desulfuromonadales bacterium]
MNITRSSGILLHPTSLPGRHGIGDLGEPGYSFVDFMARSGQSVWQILPLGPTGYGDSPYSSYSAFAGNPLLISLERLVETGDLTADEVQDRNMPEEIADYEFAHAFKEPLLHLAANRFRQHCTDQDRLKAFEEFCRRHSGWIEDYALYRALRSHFGDRPWYEWPADVRDRDADILESYRRDLDEAVYGYTFIEFVFHRQWLDLKEYANRRNIQLMGDLPIFVAHDSSDVWAHRDFFQLDSEGQPLNVAGVPPDYFSDTGQRWGNPLYDWETLGQNHFSWWIERFRRNLELTDLVRVDHFRGFEACWIIPANDRTAVNGHWESVPGHDLFRTLAEEFSELPIIAEDLGVITPEVEDLRDRFALPGMKVLQFAFDSGPENPYLPHNHRRQCLTYTGTHDNDTTVGWWQKLDDDTRQAVKDYLGCDDDAMPWTLIRAAMSSVSRLSVFPLQDVLGLDSKARFNTPGTSKGNWQWRFPARSLDNDLVDKLGRWTRRYGR